MTTKQNTDGAKEEVGKTLKKKNGRNFSKTFNACQRKTRSEKTW